MGALHMRTLDEQLQAMAEMLAVRRSKGQPIAAPVVEVPVEPRYEPTYTCAICKDVGMVHDEEVWVKSAYRDGLMPCPKCGGTRQAERSRMRCGLTDAERIWRLASFRELPNNGAARKAAARMIEHPRGWLTIWGHWGTGKTKLAKVIAAECLARNVSAKYRTVTNVLDEMRASYDTETKETLRDVTGGLKSVKVLTLDEFESFKGTDWAFERLYDVLSHRYEQAGRLATVIITQHEVKLGAAVIPNMEYNGKIIDRMLDGRFQVVEAKGGSLRPYATWAE